MMIVAMLPMPMKGETDVRGCEDGSELHSTVLSTLMVNRVFDTLIRDLQNESSICTIAQTGKIHVLVRGNTQTLKTSIYM